MSKPVAWRAKLKGNTGWVYYDFKPPSVFDTMTGAATRLTEIQPLYAHPEDAPLKKTPENLHSGEAIKANLHSEDAPGGPWTACSASQAPHIWAVLIPHGRWAFTGNEREAIAVRDALNRLKGETDG